jgi:tetratricopeptide (TPR) repeat protein/energy-coupling factor transporter ATP-binding protein EcfA2
MTAFNPFPGLRPFEPDEDRLFFGREKEIDDLLRRLRSTRFLSVVGTSGSGKSSLVRSGLIPSLYSGFMVTAGSSWRVAMLRPGEAPIRHLADALSQSAGLGGGDGEHGARSREFVEATLRRGSLGIVDAVTYARIPAGDNLLVVVDQFEELFRFRRSRQVDDSRDEAIAFVNLLLGAAGQTALPIYVVLTMRSDFIGDCIGYPGLPEAVNSGQYLVPRMTRDQVRLAITGPIAVAGGEIAPRLVRRLLNELGDDQDQLPVLQHALSRTWAYWEQHHQPGEPIDISAYEAIGTLRNALSLHAEEAYQETSGDRGRQIAERTFKALTDTFSDPRGVRRPTSIRELAEICEATDAEMIELVEIFRRPDRSFLMPPASVPLDARAIIDLSHESLMRRWSRLVKWAEEDRLSATFYTRLSQAARWFDEGSAGLWRDPELELGLRWRRETEPTPAWGRRLDESFDRAMAFLSRSEQEQLRVRAERARERKRKLQQAWWTAAVFGVLFVIAGGLAYLARAENRRATNNLSLAKEAVDQTLSSAGLDPASAGADVPQMTQFRRELLEKAKAFYDDFLKQDVGNETLRREMALAHLRLGHIDRWLENADEAAREYEQAIGLFEALEQQSDSADYRQGRADAYNWLGLTLTPVAARAAEAGKAYDNALVLQEALMRSNPARADYQQQAARTRYNRGMLRASTADPGTPAFRAAEMDFQQAIRLLEPLTRNGASRVPSLELARADNNLAALIALDDTRLLEAGRLYEMAVGLDEALIKAEPENRVYKLELAKYCDNLSYLLGQLGEHDMAESRSQEALDLLEALALPAPSLAIEQADAHNLRGWLVQRSNPRAALAEYREALGLFERMWQDRSAHYSAPAHQRYQDLLLNLARFASGSQNTDVHALLTRAVTAYLDFARADLTPASVGDARLVAQTVSTLLPELPARDREEIVKRHRALQDRLAAYK